LSNLYVPKSYRQAQMSKPVVFWFNRKLQFIMCPPSPIAPPPNGYERIECRHAHEVELWSNRLRQQEKRIREMTEAERYAFEEPIRADMLQELRALLAKATDPVNREFLAASIRMIEQKREQRRKEVIETYMSCEAKEGVAP
jgi:hypothetical protein